MAIIKITTPAVTDDAITSPKLGTGDMTFPNGNLVFGTAGKGVYLGVTSATAANHLDDYEEGTWTPADASGASLNYINSTGQYVKIGKMVYLGGNINYPSNSSSSTMKIGGLPFTCADIGAANQYGVTVNATNVGTEHYFNIKRNSTEIETGTNTNGVIANSVYNSKFFQFFGQYQTT